MSRMNQWFVLGDGIAREVITADIQRYLGPNALVRPGTGTAEYEGRPGYWITAYRTLTSQMIQDLKLDSQRWQAEKDRDRDQRGHGGGGGVAYQDSSTHASRQHYGPSESYAQSSKSSTYSASSYGASESPHYTTTPTTQYGTTHPGYGQQAPPSHASQHSAPRTDPYANYGQQARQPEYQTPYQPAPAYSYPPQQTTDQYGRPTATPAYPAHVAPSVPTAAPGYYIASDGRQYPLSQQPQSQPPQAGRRR